MESKSKGYFLNGLKPRNNFSREILRNTVGLKAYDKLKKSFTANKIGSAAATQSQLRKARKGKTFESIPKVTSFNLFDITNNQSIEEKCKEEEEEDIPIENYMVDSGDSDSSSDEENEDNTENANMSLSATTGDFVQKDPQKLVDDELTELLKLCKNFPEPSEDQLNEKSIEFGEKKRHKTLILDMDETLIHAEIQPESMKPIKDWDFTITLKNSNADNKEETFIVYVKIRPFYDEWMENLANYFEIVVFTAAEQDYADAILDVLDTENLINHRLYRQHWINIEDRYFVKDLRIIKDRDLKDMILVDNSIISMAFNIDNGIPVAPFYRWIKNDEELLFLHSYLDEIYHIEDVRDHNKDKFKLKEIQDGTLSL